MDLKKIFKTIEHLGEGTISEIEDNVQKEENVFDDIKADLGFEDESGEDLNLDEILTDDLDDLSEISKPKEEDNDSIPTQAENQEPDINFENDASKQTDTEDIDGLDNIDDQMDIDLDEEDKQEQPLESVFEDNDLSDDEVNEQTMEFSIDDLKNEPNELEDFEENISDEDSLSPEDDLNKDLEDLTPSMDNDESNTNKDTEEISDDEDVSIDIDDSDTEISLDDMDSISPKDETDEFLDLSDLEEVTKMADEYDDISSTEIEIDDEDINIIIATLKSYPQWLSKEIKNLILNDALSQQELSTLIDLLVDAVSYKEISKYLNKTLNIEIRPENEADEKVYIPSTFEILFPYFKWGVIGTFSTFLIISIIYFFLILPIKAKNLYDESYELLSRNNIEKSLSKFESAKSHITYFNHDNKILRYGKQLLEMDYYKLAIQVGKTGKSRFPKDIRFPFLLSDIYFEQGEEQKSISNLERLKEKNNFLKDYQLYIEIGRKYRKTENYIDAIKTYNEGLRHVGKSKEINIEKFIDILNLQNLKDSMRHYEYLKEEYEDFIDEGLFSRYIELLFNNNLDFDAKDVIDRVIEYNPSYAPSYYYYGLFHSKRDNKESALEYLKTAENLVNQNKESKDIIHLVYNLTGEIYASYVNTEGDFIHADKAVINFDKAIQAKENFAKPYYNRAKIYYIYTEDFNKALQDFMKAEKYGFSNDFLNYSTGWINYNFENFDKSLMRFIKLNDKYTSNIRLKNAIGLNFIKLKKPDLAIGYLRSVVSYWENLKSRSSGLDLNIPEVRKIFLNLSAAYNNLGVAYQIKSEQNKNAKYSDTALKYFLKSKEEFSWLQDGSRQMQNSEAELNVNYLIRPDIARDLVLMDNKFYFLKTLNEKYF